MVEMFGGGAAAGEKRGAKDVTSAHGVCLK
jgi:hypothetical protein